MKPVRDGVWRIDVEVKGDPVTGQRRRISRTVLGTRHEAEVALARLKVADHDKRLPRGRPQPALLGLRFSSTSRPRRPG